jgi:nucleotide-binding universal stress UspA family protein
MNDMEATQPTLTIVVGVELDDTGHTAWLHAANLASANSAARIHLCHCHGSEADSSARAEALLSEGTQLLNAWAMERLFGHPLIARTETHVGIGDPADVIRQLAVDVSADFIIVGTHHRNVFERLTQKSTVRGLLSDAPCTIVIAQDKDYAGREASPVIEAVQPVHTAQRTLGRAHTYSYRRSIRLDFGQGSATGPMVSG